MIITGERLGDDSACVLGGAISRRKAVRDRFAFRAEQGLPLRRRRGQGPHLAKRWEPRGFSRVAAAFSSYDG